MKKILIIMAILFGCTGFGGYVEAKDYTFKIINNYNKQITSLRVNNAVIITMRVDSGKTGQVTPTDQQAIISTVDLKIDGAWCPVLFDGWAQFNIFNITVNSEGKLSIVGQ